MLKKLLFVFFCLITVVTYAQDTKEEIKAKQQQLQKEIDDLNNTLSQIKSSRKQSLGQLALVQRKIAARTQLINTINKDMRRLDDNIYLDQLQINHLRLQLDTLKQNYAKSLVFAYKNRSNYDYLNFIFSATTFNDAIKRVAYLRSYRQYRETQVSTIQKTQSLITGKIDVLNSNKVEKRTALSDQSKQLNVLQDDKKEQSQVIAQLKGKESEIAKQIKASQRSQQKLKSALQVIINREIAEAKKRAEAEAKAKALEAQKNAAANNTASNNAAKNDVASNTPNNTSNSVTAAPKTNRSYSPFESTAEGLTESLNFEGNRGRLPWPVSSGYVSIHYGAYEIPGTKLKGNSDGITISLPVGATVKSVADGEVSAVFDLDGHTAIVVRHGKYFTSYSNLSSVQVNKGTDVHAGTVLGKADSGQSGDGEVGFTVSNGSGFLNPEGWLRSR
ncbi:MAG TPA: peptidoglycan DD-metalloendopeptidase family protein [Parafilimonas sp.]|jgi:septal ring factor EnvC (AmiA/AmiB activator)|nr:peptidoglycan DD-metalloendopeptidase family protein [Parafilimonas sp.]